MKKGLAGDYLSIIMFMFLLLLAVAGIIFCTGSFFGSSYDTRESQAATLFGSIKTCLVYFGIPDSVDLFYKQCKLDKGVIEEFFKISLKVDEENKIIIGNDFESCFFLGIEENRGYAQCYNQTFILEDRQIDLIVGNQQYSRRNLKL